MTMKSILRVLCAVCVPLSLPAAASAPDLTPTREDANPPPRSYVERPRAPAGAPNIVIIVLDDLGYADFGAYGSEVSTPNIDRLASEGLRYNHFTSTALCTPTRAALLTGLNHHSAGMGWHGIVDQGYPGYRDDFTLDAPTIAELLQPYGYGTIAIGKWHQVSARDSKPSGSFHNWPTHRGFDRFYGFIGGQDSQFYPGSLAEGTTYIKPPGDGSFYLPDALTDKAIAMIRDLRVSSPDKPFLLWYATGATHTPHHTKPEDRAKYVGKYDAGWDRIRAQRLARQKKSGLVPANAVLAPRNPGVVAWDSLSADQKKMYARFQENFAAFLDRTDRNIGRLLDHLRETGDYENTIFIVTSDNGASRVVGPEGEANVAAGYFVGEPATNAENLKYYDSLGDWNTHPNYPHGWAQAGNTPLQEGKRTTDGGGARVPLIISWPRGIKARGEVRTQFHHVNDIVPTLLDVLKIEAPKTYNGHEAKPIEGVSMAYSFTAPRAPGVKREQYYEIEGNRAYYADGWRLVSRRVDGSKYHEAPWRLYNLDQDFSETRDLAAEYPEKVRELERKWWEAARRYQVLPIDDRTLLNRISGLSPKGSRALHTFYPTDPTIKVADQPRLQGSPYRIRARINRSASTDGGVIVALGDVAAGWAFYIKDGLLIYEQNRKTDAVRLVSDRRVPTGESTVSFTFRPAGSGAGGTGTLEIDGAVVGRAPIRSTAVGLVTEGMEIGRDELTAAVPGYVAPFTFTGRIERVDFELGTEDLAARMADTGPRGSP